LILYHFLRVCIVVGAPKGQWPPRDCKGKGIRFFAPNNAYSGGSQAAN